MTLPRNTEPEPSPDGTEGLPREEAYRRAADRLLVESVQRRAEDAWEAINGLPEEVPADIESRVPHWAQLLDAHDALESTRARVTRVVGKGVADAEPRLQLAWAHTIGASSLTELRMHQWEVPGSPRPKTAINAAGRAIETYERVVFEKPGTLTEERREAAIAHVWLAADMIETSEEIGLERYPQQRRWTARALEVAKVGRQRMRRGRDAEAPLAKLDAAEIALRRSVVSMETKPVPPKFVRRHTTAILDIADRYREREAELGLSAQELLEIAQADLVAAEQIGLEVESRHGAVALLLHRVEREREETFEANVARIDNRCKGLVDQAHDAGTAVGETFAYYFDTETSTMLELRSDPGRVRILPWVHDQEHDTYVRRPGGVKKTEVKQYGWEHDEDGLPKDFFSFHALTRDLRGDAADAAAELAKTLHRDLVPVHPSRIRRG
ncbi:MAG: hypothetical protein WD603_01555 [Patescibacteria group bacterium]